MAARDRRSLRWIRSVVTPYPGLARALLGDVVPDCQVMAVAGSSEGLVPDVGDACLDLVETGNSAACNGLVIRRTFRQVTTHVARSSRAGLGVVAPVLDVITSAVGSGSWCSGSR